MLQKYRSHKVVDAGKIQGINWVGVEGDPMAPERLHSVTVGGQSYVVPENFAARGEPQIGDYFVRYEPDGYVSWSPRAVFEAGYSLVEDATSGTPGDKPGDVRLPIEPAHMGAKSAI